MKRLRNVALGIVTLALANQPAFAQADNSNSKIAPNQPMSTWMNDYSQSNQGRISRQAYMDEVGRRWDLADTERRGMTTDDINRAYGYSYGPRDPVTGTSTAPGAMGPNNTKK